MTSVEQRGGIDGRFVGEAISDLRKRPEGIRLKHHVDRNGIKIYDKWSVPRAEATINAPDDFKVYRTAEGDDGGHPAWRPMRKGVADLTRRTEVSQAINDRYLDAVVSRNPSRSDSRTIRSQATDWKFGVAGVLLVAA